MNASNSTPWLTELRHQALLSFEETGLPTPREEDWRYSKVMAFNKSYNFPTTTTTSVLREDIEEYLLPDAWCVVLIDGRFAVELSSLDDLPLGITITGIAQALLSHADLLKNRLHHVTPKEDTRTYHGFISFNTAWFTDGAFIHIGKNHATKKPIQILHLATKADNLAVTRSVIICDELSETQVIETFVGLTPAYLTNTISEVFVGKSAQLSLTKMQCESGLASHFGGTYLTLSNNARLVHHNFAFGGLWARSDVHCDLNHAAQCELNGLYIGEQRQHIDNHTRITHLQPQGTSRELYKGVLNDRARGVFQGRVIVSEQASKTDSVMNNRNLLLSNEAEVDTKPQLEIYNDDVKCGHGVTVGQLNESSIFYLQSRGINVDTARNMLIFAFANEMVAKVTLQSLHDKLLAQLLLRFPQQGVSKEWL